jgi:hypothetical protein
MDKSQKIINSFTIRNNLNPKVWDGSSKDIKMNPKVRKALLRISEEFINYLGEDVFVEDVILTGSLSNYNWSEYSDFDLHVLIDFNQYGKQSELYKNLFDLKKQVFNDKHNIKIFGYDVELYTQDEDESHYSSGVYSILDDEWLTKPEKVKFALDKDVLKSKIKCWSDKIDSFVRDAKKDNDVSKLELIKDKLKKYRKSGLEKKGELSYENLVFKYLRRSGYIGDLMDSLNKVKDKELSIESQKIDEALSNYNFEEKKPGILDGLDNSFLDTVEPFISELDSIGCSGRFTSGRRSSGKNKRSLHLTGQALDMTFSTDDCYCKAMDLCAKYPELFCLDERNKITRDWTAPHLHVSVAQSNGARTKPCGAGTISASDYGLSGDKLISDISKMVQNNKKFVFQKNRIKYDPDIKIIQSALQDLGFLFSRYGIDGKFGNETRQKVLDFQKEYNLDQTGNITSNDLEQIMAALYDEKLDF